MKAITPPFKGENKGHYSPGMLSGNLLFISGQLSIDPDTRLVPQGGAEEHARLALNNVDRVLKEAGLSPKNVVFCQVYVTGMEHWDTVNAVYASYFGDHKPARVVSPVPELHFGCMVEIMAIAEVPAPTQTA